MLIALNIEKTAISFGMSFELLNWILKSGYANMIAGVFTAVLFMKKFAVVILIVWGKKLRFNIVRRGWHVYIRSVDASPSRRSPGHDKKSQILDTTYLETSKT
jgi:hypothetical protein